MASKNCTASFALFDCSGPIRCSSTFGYWAHVALTVAFYLAISVPVTVALMYGDWSRDKEPRKISQREMSALNELARELGRFFAHAPTREVETL